VDFADASARARLVIGEDRRRTAAIWERFDGQDWVRWMDLTLAGEP
jgi:hypothetical protein